jgi:O-acetyl-ADP-ribose deacetylase (regulator of RNase III)
LNTLEKQVRNLKTQKGDIIELACAGHFDAIAHGCNCFCTFGAGLARDIAVAFPNAEEADRCTLRGDKGKLGLFSVARVKIETGSFMVFNLYTQYFLGKPREPDDNLETRYKAIESSLTQMRNSLPFDASIALPKIGAGLAGGNWEVIKSIIYKTVPQACIVELPRDSG